MAKAISEYTRKRNFNLTSEPPEKATKGKHAGHDKPGHALQYVIQKHDARRLHYDFRLELNGSLKSWAIPKGPSLDPKDKRLAVHVEDHPLGYASFEGHIPKGQYGGGDVIVWDSGVWQPLEDPALAYKNGKLKFILLGKKLTGAWNLVRTKLRGSGDKEQWLLIKERDQSARPADEYDIVAEQPKSVLSEAIIRPKPAKPISAKKAGDVKKSQEKPQKDLPAVAAKIPAEKSRFPETLKPELATLVSEPPEGNWLYEIKLDGYRILARIHKGKARLFTRNGNDWTHLLPLQAKALEELNLHDSWLDGELVVLNEKNIPDFQLLQNAFDIGRSQHILYYLFDAPFLNGRDLQQEPVELRRAELEKAISVNLASTKKFLRFSAAFTHNYRDILASACAMSLEGVIGKRLGSCYQSRRSPDWIKLKCKKRQEFVIAGFTLPKGSRSGFGALLLAVHERIGGRELVYAGRVGTGFDNASLMQLHKKMSGLTIAKSPLDTLPAKAQVRDVQWIKPVLVCEVEFAEWTGDNVLRQASFIALRSDKPAKDIVREQAHSPAELTPLLQNEESTGSNHAEKKSAVISATSRSRSQSKKSDAAAAFAITHPERIIDPASKATKKDLAMFYLAISDWLVPHLSNRPVAILRAPSGIAGEQFFQKHTEHLAIPHVVQLDRALDPGHAALMEINKPAAIVGAVQMGAIEFHTWGSASNNIERPNRIILDLDPDPALPWKSVLEATQLTLAVLDELKLEAYLKTTGGKGMHIVIPFAPVAGWDEIKVFSKAITQFMAQQIPERFVAKMGPQNRLGKIFVDYLRNQRGASTVAAYSVRARPGLPVSVPIAREELLGISSSAQWNIASVQQRLQALEKDPWDGYNNRQKISLAQWKKLGVEPPR